jgi:hypothetical protein
MMIVILQAGESFIRSEILQELLLLLERIQSDLAAWDVDS